MALPSSRCESHKSCHSAWRSPASLRTGPGKVAISRLVQQAATSNCSRVEAALDSAPAQFSVSTINEETTCLKGSAVNDFQEFGKRYRPTCVAIVGAGSVGTATASSIISTGKVSDILINDLDSKRLIGEVLDLSDSAFMNDCNVRAASLQEAGQADVVVVTAGAKQRPNEPRTELIERNIKIMNSIMDGMKPFGENTVLLIVANPVDVLTNIAQMCSGLPRERVIGSGTYLDTMRLRGEIGRLLGVNSKSVHIYVIGEHGDSQVATWTAASVGGIPLHRFPELTAQTMADLSEFTKRKAYKIIKAKGATYFGISCCVADIVQAVLGHNSTVLPLSAWSEEHQIYISQPCVLGRAGIMHSSLNLLMSDAEKQQLSASVTSMQSVLKESGF